MSVPRCRFAARSGKPRLVGSLGLLFAGAAVLLLPALALAVVSSDGGCLCQSPQPPGDSLTVVALHDACHGWMLSGGPALVTSGCGLEAVTTGALTPQGCTRTAASVGRPPPPGA